MHEKNILHYQHSHDFHEVNKSNVRRVSLVVVITVVTMIAEILFGWLSHSMALLSDGWHMATHASAMSITWFTYYIAQKHKHDRHYSFGTWKVEVLGAYTSAILLGLVAASVLYSSLERLLSPIPILYDQALIVALMGLMVNVICAAILSKEAHPKHT
ncbi:MAG: cation diffusion facilitator family transporter, partial [Candidatus Margulisiibacteriota bacterium]